MSLPLESYQALDDAISRLAAESMLAKVGSDEGLLPAYSLLTEIREYCAAAPTLLEKIATRHLQLEGLLDAAKPFDEPTVENLRRLVAWLPEAVECEKAGRELPAEKTLQPFSSRETPKILDQRAEINDEMLHLHLEENQELLVEFHGEAVEHLQQIEAALLVLDQSPENLEALNSIFRSFHTIKGNAGFLGLVPMQALAHEVESVLDLARNRKLRLNEAIITEILRSRDALQLLTQQVGRALELGHLPSQIVPVGHLIEAVKKLAAEAAETETRKASVSKAPFAKTAPPFQSSDSDPGMAGLAGPALAAAAANIIADKSSKSSAASATVRVNTNKLDSLMDVVGELVIVQGQLTETARQIDGGPTSPLQRNVSQLNRITKELQRTAMALRMIPIKPTFQKMERLVRDLARDFGKKVQFVTSGDETELDRTVVEEIGDPLVHMVRNALDHGLETSSARVMAGKSETGTLHLKAYHESGDIVVELQDDGRGIDPQLILRKAVEKRIVTAEAELSREEIFALIFAPGFSTAEKVTAVSGRGVGMDVVKRNIEKLRGKIEVTSEVGKGSTFKIKLPLTMAIIDGLVVRVGTDRFILPTTSVQRALRPSRENISTVHGRGEVLDLRGRLIPVFRLHQRFSIPHDAENPWDGIAVIVEHSGKISALLVDEMVSKQEVVIKNLGAFMQNLPGVAGGAILGDGNIALILDPHSLLNAA